MVAVLDDNQMNWHYSSGFPHYLELFHQYFVVLIALARRFCGYRVIFGEQ